MKRTLSVLLPLLSIAAFAAPAQAGGSSDRDKLRGGGGGGVLDEYCSPTGDYCLDVRERRGRIKLEIATFSFRGRYELCVRGPEKKVCRSLKLSNEGHGIYSDRVDLKRRFGDQGSGRYKAVWKKSARLGKLRFEVVGSGPV